MTFAGLDPMVERVLDLAGVLVFALSGAQLGAQKRFDTVGIAALATATALGGGMTRDVLLGDTPPAALRDQMFLIVPLVATAMVLVGHRAVERISRPVLVFDAMGLGLFCVVGTAKALDHGLGAVPAVLLGVITAVGGGVIRDTLARDVPWVFRPDSTLYAIPATLGAVAVVVLWPNDALNATSAAVVVAAVFGIRVLSARFGWKAPTARG
ncbi:trimeric intracellular cation channel family protein [Euzebya rosea]|uniref:trimeric intracellular cation channel family protein n=1 Tax=Euzebya rosea TaxID=2052804 RepID=UPI000D3E6AF8|nr:trimeric intracellular cation channel family protein [Euzebya rosea]